MRNDKYTLTEEQLKELLLASRITIGVRVESQMHLGEDSFNLNEEQYKSLLNATKMTRYAGRSRMMVILSYGVRLRGYEIAAITVGDVLDWGNSVR